jgi:RNA polymerase sigma factor (sigma-70 family)
VGSNLSIPPINLLAKTAFVRTIAPMNAVPHDSASAPAGAAQFPPTLWSVVLEAAGMPSDRSEKALATLCGAYWYPLYAYLRRRGCSPHDAQDLTQSFLVHLFNGHKLGNLRPEKGRFRSFLRVALPNFLADERSKAHALKRGGGTIFISLEGAAAEGRYGLEPAVPLDPEKIFERRWAMTLLESVLGRLERECQENQRSDRFQELRVYLLGDPALDSYARVAERLGMSEGAVKVAVLRLRQRYRELFREAVAETVGNEAEIEDEIRHIFSILSS